MVDYFERSLAWVPDVGPLPNAEAEVYAIEDTGFTTPLELTDLADVPMPLLVADSVGVFPPFRVPTGQTDVIVKSGAYVTQVRSEDGKRGAPGADGEPGPAGLGLPDPSVLPSGYVAVVVGGQWSAGPAAAGGGSGPGGVLFYQWNGSAYVDQNGEPPPAVKPAGWFVLRVFLTNGDPTAPVPTYPTWVGVEDHWTLPGEA